MTTCCDIFCIVRSVGERTTDLCMAQLEKAFGGKSPCVRIETQPFTEALRQTMRIGSVAGRKWTLVMDADVLASTTALAALPALIDQMPPNGFMLHASVWDKFFGRYRRAGNRVYRTELLEQALSLIPEDGCSVRPESDTCYKMVAQGYRIFKSYQIIGLHDYEQDYLDILRKSVLFGLKHIELIPRLRDFWQSGLPDSDYAAALDGLNAAPVGLSSFSIDKNLLYHCSDEILAFWQAQKKPDLNLTEWDEARIQNMLEQEMSARGLKPATQTDIVEYV